jgi:hypothetical protein
MDSGKEGVGEPIEANCRVTTSESSGEKGRQEKENR